MATGMCVHVEWVYDYALGKYVDYVIHLPCGGWPVYTTPYSGYGYHNADNFRNVYGVQQQPCAPVGWPVRIPINPYNEYDCGPRFGGKSCTGKYTGNCCGIHGRCGMTDSFCAKLNCDPRHGPCIRAVTDFTLVDNRCGPWAAKITNRNGRCSGEFARPGYCCSRYGVCGNEPEHCLLDNCDPEYGDCTENENVGMYELYVRAGVNKSTESGTVYNIKGSYYDTALYSQDPLQYDLAVVEVTTDIIFDDNIKPIQMAWRQPNMYNRLANATGYGLICYESCRTAWKNDRTILDNMICAEDTTTTQNPSTTCQGDSGGPLTILDTHWNDHVLLGIISTGDDCETSKPAVFSHQILPIIPYPNDNLPLQVTNAIQGILLSESVISKLEKESLAGTCDGEARLVSKFAEGFVQLENGVKIPPSKCEKCDLTNNLTDGSILCGQWEWWK
ncbi:hypothetical protein HA402_005566 [Bradysia odoriphaga]|nr:hypothetical protein HA402_005566 [Bradysia odoriphaga]